MNYLKTKKILIFYILFLLAIGYIQPIIKYSTNKLKCQSSAKGYITKKLKLNKADNETINMISVNFCNGGKEIDNFGSN